MYNQLPEKIKKKFKVIYSELKSDGFTIYKSQDQKWGVIKNDSELIIDARYESIQYEEVKNWFIGVNFSKENRDKNWSYYFHADDGKLISQTNQYSTIKIDKFGNIICKKDNKFGLLNDNLQAIIEPKYEQLSSLRGNLFRAKSNQKYGIIDKNESIIYDFIFSQSFGTFNNDLLIIEEESKYYQIDSKGKKRKKLEYAKILRATSNTYAAPLKEDENKFKVLTDASMIKDEFDIDDMFSFSGKWGIIDYDGSEIIEPKYSFIDFLRSTNYYKVAVGQMKFELSEDGKWMAKGSKWGIINKGDKFLISANFTWVEEISDNIFAVNLGGIVYYNDNYWTVRGGKWGVMNGEAKNIVPIEYDCIMLSWFRVKDFLFVQKGTDAFNGELEYDVYDFEGNKIIKNKPNYRKHMFYH